jgi:hypothetical protein
MRLPLRAATAVAALAATALPLAPAAHAADPAVRSAGGCITTWLDNGGLGQYSIDFKAFVYYTVHTNPDGSITVNPFTPVNAAAFLAGAMAGRVLVLVQCIA